MSFKDMVASLEQTEDQVPTLKSEQKGKSSGGSAFMTHKTGGKTKSVCWIRNTTGYRVNYWSYKSTQAAETMNHLANRHGKES